MILKMTVNTKNKGLLLIIVMFFVAGKLPLSAQDINRGQEEQVTIRGSYDPSINQAFKINTQPGMFSPALSKQQFSFTSIDATQPTKVSLQPIAPAKVRTERRVKTYNNYLVAGIGSWISPYLNFAHSSGNRKDAVFSVSLYHLSSFKNIPDYSPSPTSNTKLSLNWEKVLDNHLFSIGADYKLKTNRFYGFKPDDYSNVTINDEDLTQMFNLVKAHALLKSNYTRDNKLNHSFGISAYYYFDKYKSSETYADFDFDLHKSFSVSKKLNYQHLGLSGKLVYFGNADTIQKTTEFYVEGTPYFRARYGIINFLIGLKFGYVSASDPIFAFNPDIKVDLNVIEEGLTIYVGVDGGLEKNSLFSLTSVNPWMALDTLHLWQNNNYNAFGGIRGNIGRQLGFNFRVSYLGFKNMAFFVNTSESVVWGPPFLPQNKFLAVYDDGNVLNIKAELTYSFGNDLNIWLKGEYNNYTLDSLSQPYHKPITFVSFGGAYLIAKKVELSIEAFASGQRYAIDNETFTAPTEITLPGFIDLNFKVTYYLNENFSIWLSGTNLLNNSYQTFYNYPLQGLEVMGGIGLRF